MNIMTFHLLRCQPRLALQLVEDVSLEAFPDFIDVMEIVLV